MDLIDPHCAARLDEIPGYVYARADRLMSADLDELIDQLEHLAAYRAVDLWDERARIEDLDATRREIHAHTQILPDPTSPTRTPPARLDPRHGTDAEQCARLVRSIPYADAVRGLRGSDPDEIAARYHHLNTRIAELTSELARLYTAERPTTPDIDAADLLDARINHNLALCTDDERAGLAELYYRTTGQHIGVPDLTLPAPVLGVREPEQLPLGELVRARDAAHEYEPVDDLDATQHAADLAALEHEYTRRAGHHPDSPTPDDNAAAGDQRDHLTTADAESHARDHQRQTVDTHTVAATADEGEHTYLGVSRARNAEAALHRAQLGLTTSQLALDEIHHQLTPNPWPPHRSAGEADSDQDGRALDRDTL